MQATEFIDLIRRRHATQLVTLARLTQIDPNRLATATALAAMSQTQHEADEHAFRAYAYANWSMDAPLLDLATQTVDWDRHPCLVARGRRQLRLPNIIPIPTDDPRIILFPTTTNRKRTA
jgi:hypothetical protein